MELKNIVWAYDGSEESKGAFQYAKFFARLFGSKIFGIYVSVVPESIALERVDIPEHDVYTFILKAENHHRDVMESLSSELAEEGIEFEGYITRGKPSTKILEYAEASKGDLIIMGKRGLGLWGRFLVGSTTMAVLRKAHTPVLTVKPRADAEEIRLERILVPYDINEEGSDALDYTLELALRVGASVDLLYVVRLDLYTYETPATIIDELIEASQKELDKRVEEARAKVDFRLEVEGHVQQGLSTAVTIAEHATKRGVDLIVTNTHSRGTLRRILLGSVSEKVIQEADVPVLTVKPALSG